LDLSEKALETLPIHAGAGLHLADHGAGKSYLGFILYDLVFKNLANGTVYGIETRSELVEKSRALAQRLGFDRMAFLNLSVVDSLACAALPPVIDVVTALHACDTATDDAIRFGLEKRARVMVLVPCCQAEVARHLNLGKAHAMRRTPWPSCGATPCMPASWAAKSPTSCAACTWRPVDTK